MSPAVVGRRERKKAATKELLRANALSLFADKGFDGTTILDITEASDVSQRTFFLHFDSKEDVLLAYSADRLALFGQLLAEQPVEIDPLTAVRTALLSLAEDTGVDRDELMLRSRLMTESPSVLARNLEQLNRFEQAVASDVALRTGLDPRKDPYPALFGACTMGVLRVAVTAWCEQGGQSHIEDLITQSLHQLSIGLATPLAEIA